MSVVRRALLPAAILLVSCTDAPLSPDGGSVPAVRLAQGGAPGPEVVASVTGGVGTTRPLADGRLVQHVAISAHLLADGTARGRIEVVIHFTGANPAFEDHEEVTCLHVRGNEAWIGVVVTRSQDLAVGRELVYHVIDHGRAPDEIQRNAMPAERCVLEPAVVPLVTLRNGDLRIVDRR